MLTAALSSTPALFPVFRIIPRDFYSFGSRRGNDAVMVRGTFNHGRLNNKLVSKRPSSLLPSSSPSSATATLCLPDRIEMDIFDASEYYRNTGTPLIILAGKDYGCGPSRDWVAKGPWMLVRSQERPPSECRWRTPSLQGVRAVLAENFEAQHRSNLIGMSILPLQFQQGENCQSLNLNGTEIYSIEYDIYSPDRLAMIKVNRDDDDDDKECRTFLLFA
jgi:aconitate hydratase